MLVRFAFPLSNHVPTLRLFPSLLLLFGAAAPGLAQRAAPVGPQGGPAAGGAAPRVVELAGEPLARFPRFQYVQTFNAGASVWVAIDPGRYPLLRGKTVDVYLIPHGSAVQAGDPLVPAAGSFARVELSGPNLKESVFELNAGSLPGASGSTAIALAYDVVVDVGKDGRLDGADLIDGQPGRPGFHVVTDLTQPGPHEVVEEMHNAGGFLMQDIYYPADIASLGELPLIVVSHGNGHDFRWYDHIGFHMASWGYVVMSHRNNTMPGPEAASQTTITNTDHFLTELGTILGGVLDGHVDGSRIVWLGHSRGAEGVVRAYRRMLEGDEGATPASFGTEDVRLVSSIAPVDFLMQDSDVGDVPFSLWTGGADADVNGCADCNQCQTFHLYERADGERFSISLHGVGHGDFHDGGGGSVANGPCRVGRGQTHEIMRGYFLPLVKWVLEGDLAAYEFMWRQWEDLRPIGAPEDPCVVVDLMYQEPPDSGKAVLDDFQSELTPDRSSSGGLVTTSMLSLVEGRLDDPNNSFNPNPEADPMNGMTLAGFGDDTRGIVFAWDGTNELLSFQLPPGWNDLTGHAYLSFRAAQSTRAPETRSVLGDLDFSVELFDFDGNSSRIAIGAYGGGIEEPYQRPRCGGMGLMGWAAEFETVKLALEDFRSDGVPLDLSRISAVTFLFGPDFGSAEGRIGLDEIEFTTR